MAINIVVDVLNPIMHLRRHPTEDGSKCECVYLEMITEGGDKSNLRFASIALFQKYVSDVTFIAGQEKI